MTISGRCDYGCRAMIELAAHVQTREPVSSQYIAEKRGIPEKYLTHILLQLKRAGLVRSVRGAQGGYQLTASPERISLLQIVEAIDGPMMALPKTDGDTSFGLQMIWAHAGSQISAVLAGITLRRMLDMTNTASMYHI